ncbi:MAG: hypothetical protein R2695_09050 [Acidimicrobiales bacterium]
MDATIAQGMSGGPAVDATGRIVGIIVARAVGIDTALVVEVPDLGELPDAALIPGTCPASA